MHKKAISIERFPSALLVPRFFCAVTTGPLDTVLKIKKAPKQNTFPRMYSNWGGGGVRYTRHGGHHSTTMPKINREHYCINTEQGDSTPTVKYYNRGPSELSPDKYKLIQQHIHKYRPQTLKKNTKHGKN